MTRVRDLMSRNPLTVTPDAKLGDILGRLRRIGHEGYPVIENGQVVGLLTARDMNRAAENAYQDRPVRDIMQAGNVFVSPDTHMSSIAPLMIDTDWGQLPVIENGNLVGIITRTDVMGYYVRREVSQNDDRIISHQQVADVLGDPIAALIAFIAHEANQQGHIAYMVGGVVRDLLLQRPNLDIDFVLEGSAIPFARHLVEHFGGRIETHDAFGTAKWIFDDTAAAHIGHPLDDLPPYIDLVTARYEFYEGFAVLPTVYDSGIKLDLRRRDFTINALAVRLRADGASGTIIDLFGGLDDLQNSIIRALHSLSFADDPTRSLRAVRFAHRLGFTIEPRTAALIQNALPMMSRITGERLRNELTLLLKEPHPEQGLLQLQSRGILTAIHPRFVFDAYLITAFQRADQRRNGGYPASNRALYKWLIAATCLNPDVAAEVAERMVFRKSTIALMRATSDLVHQADNYLQGNTSDITLRLDTLPLAAVETAWSVLDNPQHVETLRHYIDTWRHIQPMTTGNDLKIAGLPPGPQFRRILETLRIARIDGHIQTDADERAYLQTLLESEQNT